LTDSPHPPTPKKKRKKVKTQQKQCSIEQINWFIQSVHMILPRNIYQDIYIM
jgi:hypothetical protein